MLSNSVTLIAKQNFDVIIPMILPEGKTVQL